MVSEVCIHVMSATPGRSKVKVVGLFKAKAVEAFADVKIRKGEVRYYPSDVELDRLAEALAKELDANFGEENPMAFATLATAAAASLSEIVCDPVGYKLYYRVEMAWDTYSAYSRSKKGSRRAILLNIAGLTAAPLRKGRKVKNEQTLSNQDRLRIACEISASISRAASVLQIGGFADGGFADAGSTDYGKAAAAIEAQIYDAAMLDCGLWKPESTYSTRAGEILALLDCRSALWEEQGKVFATGLLSAGAESVGSYGSMSNVELCPSATSAIRSEIELRSRQVIDERTSEMFKCSQCHKSACVYTTAQRRSLDEAPDYNCRCVACGHCGIANRSSIF